MRFWDVFYVSKSDQLKDIPRCMYVIHNPLRKRDAKACGQPAVWVDIHWPYEVEYNRCAMHGKTEQYED